jgi:hypothetical protein
MTIELKPGQEWAIQQAISAGVFRSVDEFIDTAIALLPNAPVSAGPQAANSQWRFDAGALNPKPSRPGASYR